jgi:hypothetical protein
MLHVVICSSLTLVGFIQAPAAEQGAADREPVPLAALECEVPDEIVAGELDMDLWSVRLSEGDLDLRMAAYEAIVGAGGRDRRVFDCLGHWAADPTRSELAWTARMALRELERTPPAPVDPWELGSPSLDWMRDASLGQSGLSLGDLERSLDRKFEALQRHMEHGFAPGAALGRGQEQRLFRIEFGPRGMRVLTLRIEDGGREERLGPIVPLVEAGPRTDVLGVECRALGGSEAADLGLPDGSSGLLVVRTVPGSIADELGVRRGDVLMSLNGAPLESPVHLTQALARRAEEAPIQLRLFDAKRHLRSLLWSPRVTEGE